jgi:hypothetical protein
VANRRKQPEIIPPKKMGRPSEFSEETVTAICGRMAQGETLSKVCTDPQMPAKNTVLRWLEAHEDFRTRYARARQLLMDHWADLIIDIAWDDSRDAYVDAQGNKRWDHENIQRSRLKVDTLKWLMSKISPKRYGDKLALAAEGPEGDKLHRIERVIIGWQKDDPAPPPPPPAQLTFQPLPANLAPEILARLVTSIRNCVPDAVDRPPGEVLDEIFQVVDEALMARYGSARA